MQDINIVCVLFQLCRELAVSYRMWEYVGSLQAYLQKYINTFPCAFSRCHSYLCRHTRTFSPSLRSVGNKVAGIPFGSKTPPSSAPPLFVYIICLQRYRSGPVRQRQIISWPQRTVVSFCGFKGKPRDTSRLQKEGSDRSFRNSCSSGVLHGKTSSTWNRHIVKDACMCYSVSQLIFQGKINEDHLFVEAMTLKAGRRRAKSVMWAVSGSSRWHDGYCFSYILNPLVEVLVAHGTL